jgi:hypothetical protein
MMISTPVEQDHRDLIAPGPAVGFVSAGAIRDLLGGAGQRYRAKAHIHGEFVPAPNHDGH